MVDNCGSIAVAEITFSGTVYIVDETGVLTVPFDTVSDRSAELDSAAPDPLADGTLVARFD